MEASAECIYCIVNKADKLFCEFIDDEKGRIEFAKEILKEVSSYDNATAPFLNARVMQILKKWTNIEDLYLEEKQLYNKRMILLQQDIMDNINNSDDKLLSALRYAIAGNFIDFGAMDEVDDDLLDEIIEAASTQEIDTNLYAKFKEEILNAKQLCYLVDNAGEIVFDKLFVKSIKEMNKNIEINIVVRGKPVLNDVTKKDAQEVGIDIYGAIVENGTDIPGTDLSKINDKTKDIMDSSDLIIAKGQGNFETLWGCGKNVYYLFLCKCGTFTKKFSIPKYKGVFVHEVH